jgi:hypothetical protein
MTDDLQELSVLFSALPDLPRAVASSLDEKGFAVLEGVFDRRSIEAARGVVADAVDRASKDPSMLVADGAPMVPLLNAGQPIDRLWSHPLILAVVRHLVGPAFRLQHVGVATHAQVTDPRTSTRKVRLLRLGASISST